jgi:hypothetical protein
MGKLLDQAQLKLEEMENRAHKAKKQARSKADALTSDETTDTY